MTDDTKPADEGWQKQYRDDPRWCLMLRFGKQHPPHDYRYEFWDDGVLKAGTYYCTGVSEDEAGKPFPMRQFDESGETALELGVNDLIAWWHVYGTGEPWEPTGEPLPIGLDDAARVYLDPVRQALRRGVHKRDTEKPNAWEISVVVPLGIAAHMREALHDAISNVVVDWMPEDRQGWDASVESHSIYDDLMPTVEESASGTPTVLSQRDDD